MRIDADRLARWAPMAVGVTAAGLLGVSLPALWVELDLTIALVVGAVLGVGARILRARGRRRGATALAWLVVTAAVALAFREIVSAPDWVGAVAATVLAAGPLGVAIFAVGWTRGGASLAVGAATATVLGTWSWGSVVPALLALGFVFGRDVLERDEGTPRRQALALTGTGALAALFAIAIGFDLTALLFDTFRPDTMMSRAEVDGATTFVPRVATETVLLVACLAHARGRSCGVLALAVLAPLLLSLIAATKYLPWIGAGCFSWSHPLQGNGGERVDVFEIALALAVIPWVAPIVRALRPSPR